MKSHKNLRVISDAQLRVWSKDVATSSYTERFPLLLEYTKRSSLLQFLMQCMNNSEFIPISHYLLRDVVPFASKRFFKLNNQRRPVEILQKDSNMASSSIRTSLNTLNYTPTGLRINNYKYVKLNEEN